MGDLLKEEVQRLPLLGKKGKEGLPGGEMGPFLRARAHAQEDMRQGSMVELCH